MSDSTQSTPDYASVVRKMTDNEILQWNAGWKPGTHQRLAGEYELDRRRDHGLARRSWIAIGISVASLAISLFVALKK